MDLVNRKLLRDQGTAVRALVAEMAALDADLTDAAGESFAVIRHRLAEAVAAATRAAEFIEAGHGADAALAGSAAAPFLELVGLTCGGWMMARLALAANRRMSEGSDAPFLAAKIATARFFAEALLPRTSSLLSVVEAGSATLASFNDEWF
jgi:hypothetical protein